jgi:hypothetical protein
MYITSSVVQGLRFSFFNSWGPLFVYYFAIAHLLFFTIAPFFLLSAIQVAVASHGVVHEVNIGGQGLPGWNPFDDPYVASMS